MTALSRIGGAMPAARLLAGRGAALLTVLALTLAAAAQGARAQSLSAAASAIETQLAQGQREEAVVAARRFLRMVTDQAGLGVTNVRLTTAPAEGFGVYQPRETNIYREGEPVYAYVEVYGFSLSPLANGGNRLLFDVSFTLDDLDGNPVTEQMIPMGEVRLDSYSRPVDGYFHLTYRVTGVVGQYRLRTVVTDRASGQRVEFVLPVEFTGNNPAPMNK